MEAEIIHSGIEAENAVDLFIFADAHSCALLREAALHVCILHRLTIMESEGWKRLTESPVLLKEVVQAMSGLVPIRQGVATLIQKLDSMGMDVDGTRETLIRRLEEAADEAN